MSTVLIVEDEKHICQFISVNLQIRGYNTLQAESAEEGLQILEQTNPQVLILDIKLPGMSGWEMLDVIDKHPSLPKIPVIIMTASSVLSHLEEYPYPNIVDKLTKPVTAGDLVRTVSSVFSSPLSPLSNPQQQPP